MAQIQYCVCGSIYDITNDIGSFIDTKDLHIEKNNVIEKDSNEIIESANPEEFIAELVDIPVETVKDDMDLYEETLTELENNTIRDGSKLLDDNNKLSLLAMVAYSYKNDIDLDEWLEDYAARNNTYVEDTKKNFNIMIDDLQKYNERLGVA